MLSSNTPTCLRGFPLSVDFITFNLNIQRSVLYLQVQTYAWFKVVHLHSDVTMISVFIIESNWHSSVLISLCTLFSFPFVFIFFDLSARLRLPPFFLRLFRLSLANTNYTVSNPCMSVSRSLIIPSLFHLQILCSSLLPPFPSL